MWTGLRYVADMRGNLGLFVSSADRERLAARSPTITSATAPRRCSPP